MRSASIQLTFINESNDRNNSSVVIFQQNVATGFEETALAWRVIRNCAPGWKHPFLFSFNLQVNVRDEWGNQLVSHLPAAQGQAFSLQNTPAGPSLTPDGAAANPQEIEISNKLSEGTMTALVYRDNKVAVAKNNLAPGQKAVFALKPTIWIGVVSQAVEGMPVTSAIMQDINTEISLLGIAKADIVMTGGGVGPDATPYTFSLTNITYA